MTSILAAAAFAALIVALAYAMFAAIDLLVSWALAVVLEDEGQE